MGFPRQGYWSALPFPSAENLPDPGIKLESPLTPALPGKILTLNHQGIPYNILGFQIVLHKHGELLLS